MLGVLALRDIAAHDEKAGRGRAWLGIVLGATMTVLYGLALLVG